MYLVNLRKKGGEYHKNTKHGAVWLRDGNREGLWGKWHLRWALENEEAQAMCVWKGLDAGRIPKSKMAGPKCREQLVRMSSRP